MATDKDTNNDSRADTRQDAATKGTSEIIHRKRRLSKRERKNLKKQKANLDVPPSDISAGSSGRAGVVPVSLGSAVQYAFLTVWRERRCVELFE